MTAKTTTKSARTAKKADETVTIKKTDFDALLERVERLEKGDEQPKRGFSWDDEDIGQHEYIPVMSLLLWPLTLQTGEIGKKPYDFKKMFDVKKIIYTDLAQIIDNHPTFAENGYFYILDNRIVRRHGLEPYYEKVLSQDKIKEILKGVDVEKAITLFKSANKKQQMVIANSIIKMLKDGDELDMNIVHVVSRETNIDIVNKSEEEDFLPKDK